MSEGVNNGPRDNSFRGVGYKTLAAMAENPESVRSQIMASGHRDVGSFMTEDTANVLRAQMTVEQLKGKATSAVEVPRAAIRRGTIMLHAPTGHKVTIMAAAIGKDKESKQTMHEVIDNKTGKKFLAKEKTLKFT